MNLCCFLCVQEYFTDPELRSKLKNLEKEHDTNFEINQLIQNFKANTIDDLKK